MSCSQRKSIYDELSNSLAVWIVTFLKCRLEIMQIHPQSKTLRDSLHRQSLDPRRGAWEIKGNIRHPGTNSERNISRQEINLHMLIGGIVSSLDPRVNQGLQRFLVGVAIASSVRSPRQHPPVRPWEWVSRSLTEHSLTEVSLGLSALDLHQEGYPLPPDISILYNIYPYMASIDIVSEHHWIFTVLILTTYPCEVVK